MLGAKMRWAALAVLLLSVALAVFIRLHPEAPIVEQLNDNAIPAIVKACHQVYNYMVYAFQLVIPYLGVAAAMVLNGANLVTVESIQDDAQVAKAVVVGLWSAVAGLALLIVWHIQTVWRKNRQLARLQHQVVALEQGIAELQKSVIIAEQPDSIRRLLQNPLLKPLFDNRSIDKLADSILDGDAEAVYNLNKLQVGNITGAAEGKQAEARKAALALALMYFYHMTYADSTKIYKALRHLMNGTWQTANNRADKTYNKIPMLETFNSTFTTAGNTQGVARHKYSKVAAFLIIGKLLQNTQMFGQQFDVGQVGHAA